MAPRPQQRPALWAARSLLPALWMCLSCSSAPTGGERPLPTPAETRVIIFVWDGLRPDSVSADDTPNLIRLRDEGVLFDEQHATYPTLTMMNAAAFATGSYPAENGFYGNDVWVAGPSDAGSAGTGAPVNLQRPVFSEDYGVLDALDRFYGGRLLLSETLF